MTEHANTLCMCQTATLYYSVLQDALKTKANVLLCALDSNEITGQEPST